MFGRCAESTCCAPPAPRGSAWPRLAVLLALGAPSAASLGACGPEEPPAGEPDAGDAGDDSDAAPPWPEPPEVPAPCTPAMELVAPALDPPSGAVAIRLSARLEPVGVAVRVRLEVHDAETGAVDPEASGPIALDIDPAGEVVAIDDGMAGFGEATVRLAAPGLVRLHATLEADGREGTAEVLAYEPRVPVWEVTLGPGDLDALLDSGFDDTRWPVTLWVDGRGHAGTVRLHGGSSREFPKKSFHVNLAEAEALDDGSRTVILRSEWNDKTLLRNWLALRMVRETTWLPAPEAELVHLRIDGELYGLMLRVESVDETFVARRGLAAAASLFAADPAPEWVPPGASLVPLDDPAGYPQVYRQRLGLVGLDDLVSLVEDVLQRPDEELAATLPDFVAVDDVLAYFAAMAVLQNHDHIRKNYFLVRDPWAGDGRFRLWPWDLDLTLGHLWTEEGDVLDEDIFTDEPPTFGERVPEHDFFNQMLTRLLAVPAWRARFVDVVHRIAAVGLAPGVGDGGMDEALCRATPELLADERKRATDDEYLGRVEELRAFVAARREFLASWEAP